MKSGSVIHAAGIAILLIASVITLSYGQNLFIPLVIALLIWFIVRETNRALDKIGPIKKHFPRWLRNLLTTAILLSVLAFVTRIIVGSVSNLIDSYSDYQGNIDAIGTSLNAMFHTDVIKFATDAIENFDFRSILDDIFNSVSGLVGSFVMILVYTLFIFLEESVFSGKIKAFFKDSDGKESTMELLEMIERSITKYVGLKSLVSLITAVGSYIALLIIGVESPAFWAFLIFIFNFIPQIGSLFATAFPAIFAVLQFGDFSYFFIVVIPVGIVQFAVGNVLEPKLMGDGLNISPLVAIISLSVWGAIWGITGMFLAVPITVILVIIFSHFESTRGVAIMMSEKGQINKGHPPAA